MFYLTDPNILTAPLTDQEFKIYNYLCKNYNVQKHTAYVRKVDVAGLFQLSINEVEKILVKFCQTKVNDLPLMQITKDKYEIFNMPSHKKFLEQVGFKQNNSYKGYRAINGYLKQLGTKENEIKKNYLYPNLEEWDLLDKLESLPKDELLKIKPNQLKYPWRLKDALKNRT